MWKNLIETNSSKLLEKAMDYSALRSQLLSQNIANVNTPKYKRLDVDFSAILGENLAQSGLKMATTNKRHIPGKSTTSTSPGVNKEGMTSMRYDENNVDVDYEMAKIAENSMFYQSLTSSWSREMSRLKMVIDGRG